MAKTRALGLSFRVAATTRSSTVRRMFTEVALSVLAATGVEGVGVEEVGTSGLQAVAARALAVAR